MKIAFDIDGTLINYKDNPRVEIIEILKSLKKSGNDITVWSGGGIVYAMRRVHELKLEKFVDHISMKEKNPANYDICFDDMEVKLARINIKV